MREAESSRTAMLAALARGLHRRLQRPPWVLDDQLALPLAGPGWQDIEAAVVPLFLEPVMQGTTAFIAARSRYAEDRLFAGDFRQYVVLGAGLDSFAWRRPDALDRVTVYEVDHPATQAWKRERADALALPREERHIFAPVDFETQTLREGLNGARFDWALPTLFSWLGVVPYLTPTAIRATLETIAGAAPGSEIVVHYALSEPHRDELGNAYVQILGPITAQSGEPLVTFWAPDEAETFVAGCGFEIIDHPDGADLAARYFAQRDDGLVPLEAERLLTAGVRR